MLNTNSVSLLSNDNTYEYIKEEEKCCSEETSSVMFNFVFSEQISPQITSARCS